MAQDTSCASGKPKAGAAEILFAGVQHRTGAGSEGARDFRRLGKIKPLQHFLVDDSGLFQAIGRSFMIGRGGRRKFAQYVELYPGPPSGGGVFRSQICLRLFCSFHEDFFFLQA